MNISRLLVWCLAFLLFVPAYSADPSAVPRCEIVPEAGDQFAFLLDGVERTRWHFGNDYAGPFFYPLVGPDGGILTRMGHPGAPNHDHHRSVWVAHYKVDGENFWNMESKGKIRQKQWLAIEDGDEEAILAVELGWFDDSERELLSHELVAAIRPLENDEFLLEVQHRLQPGEERERITLQKTNFGLFAIRVAKSLSGHFGEGALRDSEGRKGEREIFGQQARWVDYSGPVAVGKGSDRQFTPAGLTFFDHPANPDHPTRWHVREDGWMGASLSCDRDIVIEASEPLLLRYLIHVHGGEYDKGQAEKHHAAFTMRPVIEVAKATRPHRAFDAKRKGMVPGE